MTVPAEGHGSQDLQYFRHHSGRSGRAHSGHRLWTHQRATPAIPTDLDAGGAHANEATDNNYVKASERSSVSERFFLHATAYEVFDNTKDIGLVLERNLVINKSAADNGVPVEGAEFQVYGPFANVAEATTATLDASNLLKTVKTGADGKADFGNLNWFQVYVIVESSAAPGYKLDGSQGHQHRRRAQRL